MTADPATEPARYEDRRKPARAAPVGDRAAVLVPQENEVTRARNLMFSVRRLGISEALHVLAGRGSRASG
ncbi:MAG TPA: hypothetical protein VIU15_44265 [Streptomyces sp.]